MSALGGLQTIIVAEEGEHMVVWGRTKRGTVTLGDSMSSMPCPSPATAKWKAATCAFDHCCAVSDDGNVFSWGSNTFGQLGHGNKVGIDAPTMVSSDSFHGARVISVTGSGWHTACVTQEGTLFTWGRGTFGQLG